MNLPENTSLGFSVDLSYKHQLIQDIKAAKYQIENDSAYLFFISSGLLSLSELPFGWIIGARIAANKLANKCAFYYGLTEKDAFQIIASEFWSIVAINKISSIPFILLFTKMFGPRKEDFLTINRVIDDTRFGVRLTIREKMLQEIALDDATSNIFSAGLTVLAANKVTTFAKDQFATKMMMKKIISKFEKIAVQKYTSTEYLEKISKYI